jgi:DNA (cytosine-5)-methyltransferase 1
MELDELPTIEDNISLIDISEIIPYSNNPKSHPEAQVKKIASSIKNYGWDQPIVIDENKEIIKGHGRLQAAELLDLTQVPVITRTDLSDAEKKASRIADNKTAESEWLDDELETEVDLLAEEPEIEIDNLGFDDDEIDDLLDTTEQSVDELEEEPISNKALEDIKILNLYAGIGGNRKLWGDEPDVTSVEYNEEIANAYRDFFPNDTVVVDDAHEYLLNNFDEYDFIWASPPCPTHSKMRKNFSVNVGADAVYPDLKLYEEVLFLQGYFDGKWIVENVEPWYEPLIEAETTDRHMFWSNFDIPKTDVNDRSAVLTREEFSIEEHQQSFGFDLSGYTFSSDYPKDKVLKNCVHPEVGKAILESAITDE